MQDLITETLPEALAKAADYSEFQPWLEYIKVLPVEHPAQLTFLQFMKLLETEEHSKYLEELLATHAFLEDSNLEDWLKLEASMFAVAKKYGTERYLEQFHKALIPLLVTELSDVLVDRDEAGLDKYAAPDSQVDWGLLNLFRVIIESVYGVEYILKLKQDHPDFNHVDVLKTLSVLTMTSLQDYSALADEPCAAVAVAIPEIICMDYLGNLGNAEQCVFDATDLGVSVNAAIILYGQKLGLSDEEMEALLPLSENIVPSKLGYTPEEFDEEIKKTVDYLERKLEPLWLMPSVNHEALNEHQLGDVKPSIPEYLVKDIQVNETDIAHSVTLVLGEGVNVFDLKNGTLVLSVSKSA